MIELKNYEKFNKKFFNDMKYFFKIENSSLQFELIIQSIKKKPLHNKIVQNTATVIHH